MDPLKLMAKVGQRIAAERTARNMSQIQLAYRSGIGSGTLHKIEQGKGANILFYAMVCEQGLKIPTSWVFSDRWQMPQRVPSLTERQTEILEAIVEAGAPVPAAELLGIPYTSLASTLTRIYERLNVDTYTGLSKKDKAISVARRHGLIKKEVRPDGQSHG